MYIYIYLFTRCLGARQSFAERNRERLDMAFETRDAARERVESQAKAEKEGKRKGKIHTGNFQKMTWDKEGLRQEVESYEDGKQINWAELARNYKITNKKGQVAKNGGQIAKECLILEGLNLHRFKRPSTTEDPARIRRKKRRGPGGEISLPTPETNVELKEKIKLKVQSGEYTIGELIVPRKVLQTFVY